MRVNVQVGNWSSASGVRRRRGVRVADAASGQLHVAAAGVVVVGRARGPADRQCRVAGAAGQAGHVEPLRATTTVTSTSTEQRPSPRHVHGLGRAVGLTSILR